MCRYIVLHHQLQCLQFAFVHHWGCFVWAGESMQSRQSINEILGQVIYQLWNVNIYILVLLLFRPKSIKTVEEVVWFETWYMSKMNISVSKLLMDMDSPLLAARMWCKWNIILVSASSWQHTSMGTSSRSTFSSRTVKEWHSSSREKYIMWPYITSMSTNCRHWSWWWRVIYLHTGVCWPWK